MVQKYGSKVIFQKDQSIPFPDFTLIYMGERRETSPNFKPGFLFYDFQVVKDGQSKNMGWSSGTGDIAPLEFEFNARRYSLELKFSAQHGKLQENELVLVQPPVTAELTISKGLLGSITATVLFKNMSDEDAYLNKYNVAEKGNLENNVFRITCNKKRVVYIGLMAKRREPIVEDCIRLTPGQTLTTTARLDKAYKFPSGHTECRVVYKAVHQYPVDLASQQKNPIPWITVQSNEVVF